MKTYVITVSRTFPATHERKGEETHFVYKIEKGLGIKSVGNKAKMKIHTIRVNYDLWHKRFDKIEAGEACLSLRYWSGEPYRSKQIEFARLTKEDGIGLQKLNVVEYADEFGDERAAYVIDNRANIMLLSETIANNDGLSLEDFKEWFKGYDLSKPMAIIHFTDFRY